MARHGRRGSRSQSAETLRGGREDGARRVRRDAGLHGIPPEHRRLIRTNNGIEHIKRETRRRTRAVGTFPDGNSALMLVTARLKYIVENEWGKGRYPDMSELDEVDELRGKAEG